ncbi:MAG TPA: NUDIX hydrolase [Candidatus Saccharimonadales bacterium]|nr:NUDIX hydrolase [Candidatus Saccharimonadales bacterium]
MQQRRINVRGIIFKNGKIYAQKLKSPDGEHDYWCTPGGGLEFGESITEGLHREMIEETGITPQIGHLIMIQQYKDEQKEFLEFFFYIKNADDYELVDLDNTSHGNIEISQASFIDPKTEFVLPEKLATLDFAKLIAEPHQIHVSNLL